MECFKSPLGDLGALFYGHGATASIRVSNTLDLGSNPSARAIKVT